MVGNIFFRVGKLMALKVKQEFRIFLLGVVVVFVLGLILLKPFVGIVDGLWWTGVVNTLFALHIYLALGAFAGPAFSTFVKLIKKS